MHVYKHIFGFTQELLKINGHENCECDRPAVFVVDRLKVLFRLKVVQFLRCASAVHSSSDKSVSNRGLVVPNVVYKYMSTS